MKHKLEYEDNSIFENLSIFKELKQEEMQRKK